MLFETNKNGYICQQSKLNVFIMKKFFTSLSILALIATSSVFVSCSSDDNNSSEQVQQDPLLGKWTAEKIDLKMQLGDNVIIDEKDTDITSELELFFEFKENNVMSLYQKQLQSGQISEGSGTYTVAGSQLTIVISGEPQVFEYSVNNNELTLTMMTEEMYEGQVMKMEMTYYLYK